MKLSLLLLALSLTGNALLVQQWRAKGRPVPAPTPPASAPAQHALSEARPVAPETWSELIKGEPSEFVARLKAEGYPFALLRAMVQAQLREQFADRFRAAYESAEVQPYWIRGSSAVRDPKLNLTLGALARELREHERRLLGDEWMFAEASPSDLVRRYGTLPNEKILAVARINDDYNDLRSQIAIEARGIALPEDRERLILVEKERQADLARLLTPEELENYDLRAGSTSSRLRSQLTAFEPSESEYRALYRLYQQLDRDFGRTETLTREQRSQRAEAEKQLGPQIAAALGADRYADYQRTTDPSWLTAHRAVDQLDLPKAALAPLAAIQKDITQRAEALRNDRALTAEQRSTHLMTLEQEALGRLASVMGTRFEDYKAEYGYWLQPLRPAPAPRIVPAP